MQSTLLLPFCRHDIENGVKITIDTCVFGNGRPLPTNELEIMLMIPGKRLTKTDFFQNEERMAFDKIDFANELAKTPTGQQLLSLHGKKTEQHDVRFKLFYHVERSKDLLSNELTYQRFARQPQEHFGFTVSKNNKAIIGINAYQDSTEGFYTLVHELYHLYDPDLKEEPSPVELFKQELRALLFELRIYIERKKLVPHDRYSISKFHDSFLVNHEEEVGVDWAKIGYYIDTRFFPETNKSKFTFNPAKDSHFLYYDGEGVSKFKTVEGGRLFNDVLLSLFEEELKKSTPEQDGSTIVARLNYSLPQKNLNIKKIEKDADVIKRMFKGMAKTFSKDYEHLIDLDKYVPLRPEGINNIVTGGPRPRDGGGSDGGDGRGGGS
ncbi:MAG: hypothetical protein A4S09_10115 [Proteobacteria bacterium SG_bin7]|nr:MAG: hypothetical protein A4S09_10115 [Proteobacteria bacterium SG_bin7]